MSQVIPSAMPTWDALLRKTHEHADLVDQCVSAFAEKMQTTRDKAYGLIIDRHRQFGDAMEYVGDIVGEPYRKLQQLDAEIKQMRRRYFSDALRRQISSNGKPTQAQSLL